MSGGGGDGVRGGWIEVRIGALREKGAEEIVGALRGGEIRGL